MADIVEELRNWQWANEGEDAVVPKEVADAAAREIERLREEIRLLELRPVSPLHVPESWLE